MRRLSRSFTAQPPKRRSEVALALADARYGKRVVRDKKQYSRKGRASSTHRIEDSIQLVHPGLADRRGLRCITRKHMRASHARPVTKPEQRKSKSASSAPMKKTRSPTPNSRADFYELWSSVVWPTFSVFPSRKRRVASFLIACAMWLRNISGSACG